MPKRTARFLTIAFVNILAGIPLSTFVRGQTAPVEGCLSNPKGETPQGSHWYYRIDHVNKRNCWYLRREGEPPQAAQQTPKPTPPAPAKPSVVDARAELRPRPVQQDAPTVNPPANAPASQIWGNVPTGNATAAVATRWPEPATAGAISNPRSGAQNPAGEVTQPPATTVNEASFAFLDNLSAAVPAETLPTLIAAAIGALAFAGATAAFISKRGRARRLRRRDAPYAWGQLSETTDDDRIILADHPSSDSRDYRPKFGRNVKSAPAPKFVSRKPRQARG